VYADGVLRNNNPVWVVVEETRREWPENSLGCLVSLGTGKLQTRGIGTSQAELLQTCSEIVLDTEETARLFVKEYRPLAQQGRYYRFNVEQGMQDIGLDEFSAKILDRINAATDGYLDDNEEDLGKCASMLKFPTHPTRREHSPRSESNLLFTCMSLIRRQGLISI
jgi:hypothetical protein